MSDSVRPHRWQPTRLPRPWDSPGKNTAVGCHCLLQCMEVKSESEVAQSCPTLSDPMGCSPPGSSVHGIFQARVLEWAATVFSDCVCMCVLNRFSPAQFSIHLSATLWTVARQAPLSMGLSRQEWVAISFSRGSSQRRDSTESLMSPALAGELFTTSATWSICCMPSSMTSLGGQSYLILITLVWNQAISSSSR